MKKIPSVFVRDFDHPQKLVTPAVVHGCEWVINGEGVATEKFDGSAVLIRAGMLFKRYDAKHGKTPPPGWEPCETAADPATGHWPGWLRVVVGNPADRWFFEALENWSGGWPQSGTYELVGPKVGSNPHKLERHELWRHGMPRPTGWDPGVPRDYEGLKALLEVLPIEGIVFHHPDGRMAKVKARDFGLRWPR